MTTDTTQANELATSVPQEPARNGAEPAPISTDPKPAANKPDIEPSRLDADAVRVLLRLRQHHYEAYLVGGCVRDLLVGKMPKDFDIATSATPNQVRDLFRNCRLIGRRFRLAHVYFKGGKILEVSTFRASPELVDEPQPSEVQQEVLSEGAEHIAQADKEAMDAVEHDQDVPSTPVEDVQDELVARPAPVEKDLLITEDNVFGTAVEDARRRDFTINGLFYDPMEGRVIDHVRGLRDLALQEIRTIGDPEKRMREDPVRILRAVRFACKLGFEFEARTYAAMEGAVEDLPRCAPPRLLEESFRLIRGGEAAPSLRLLRALDALKWLLPPVDGYLRGEERDGEDEYFAFVAQMDAMLKSGVPFDDSQLLASILLPIALDEPDTGQEEEGAGGKPPSVAQAIEALLGEMVQKARLPRRIAERCRMILLAQRTLAGLRRRRGGLNGFRAHPLFNESLTVFEVWVKATGEHADALEKWKSGSAPAVAANAEGPRRRRRRRGGKGKEAGEAAPAGETPVAASPASAEPTSNS